MLTPAPGSKHVRWKKMQLIAKHYENTGAGEDRTGDRCRCRMAESASRARVQAQAFGAKTMSADVINFPGDGRPDHQWTEAGIDKCHGDAFRDLEMSLRDSVRMSEIAA
jgi:hypothetical protein